METRAVTLGAKTWKSRVSVIIHHARSLLRFLRGHTQMSIHATQELRFVNAAPEDRPKGRSPASKKPLPPSAPARW